jgi:cytoskeletal protein RodZ
MAVPDLLRQTRETRGLTLEQLAAETRIPLDRLASFEREGLAPDAGFYHRAWIRAYAHALGLDERVFLKELNQDLAAGAPAMRPEAAPQPSGRVRGWPSLAALCSVFAGVVIASALLINHEPHRAPAQAKPENDAVVAAVRDERTAAPAVPASLATGGIVESDVPPSTPAVAPARTVTQLVITSKPAGARVTVDGIGWGPTPVTIRHLPEGVKRIRVTYDRYAGAERLVEVQPDRVNRVSVQLRSLPPQGVE